MPVRYNVCVFKGSVTASGTVVYSDPSLNSMLGQAEYCLIAVHCGMASASAGSPNLTVELEGSNDGTSWMPKSGSPPIDAVTLSTSGPTDKQGSQTDLVGCLARCKITLGGNDPSANLEVWVCGRAKR